MSKELPSIQRDVEALIPRTRRAEGNRSTLRKLTHFVITVGLLATGYLYLGRPWSHSVDRSLLSSEVAAITKEHWLEGFQECAIKNLLDTGLPLLKKASPITVPDFQERRDRLAEALVAEDVDAFVVEPGYTFKYYGNVSQPEWEVWEVSHSSLRAAQKSTILMKLSQKSAHS